MQLTKENLTEHRGRQARRNYDFYYGVLCMSPITCIYLLQTYDIMPETTCDVMGLFVVFTQTNAKHLAIQSD